MTFFRRNLWWLSAIVPFAFLLYVVARLNVPVPFMDEWDLVPLLEKMYGGTLTLTDLWTLHNEHRLLFPQMIMLGLARLTNWDLRYELATSVLLAIGIFLLLARQVTLTAQKLGIPELRWAIPLFSVIVFSVSQYQNWLWGWQLEIFLSVLGVVGGLVLLANPPFTWLRFFGAAILGVIASYSFGNGGVFWLVGLFVLWVVIEPGPERWIRLGVWLFLTGLTMGLYFYHYERLEEHPPLTLLFTQPVQYLIYVFKYLGNFCAQYSSSNPSITGGFALLYGVGGFALALWAVMTLRRKKSIEFKLLVPFLALSLYSIGSALVVGVGRLGLGADQAVASRYCTVTAPFWASLVTLLLILSVKPKIKPKVRSARQMRSDVGAPWYTGAAKLFLSLVTLMLILGSILPINIAAQMSRTQEIGLQRLLTIPVQPAPGVDYSALGALHPRPQIILDRFPFLKERRLSIFRDDGDRAPVAQPKG